MVEKTKNFSAFSTTLSGRRSWWRSPAGSTRCSRSSSSSASAGRRAPGSKGRARGTCTAFISPALGRALRIRDRCRFPGCDHRSYFHAHHARHWARGGATEIGNLVQLCSYHHRLVHEGGFGSSRTAWPDSSSEDQMGDRSQTLHAARRPKELDWSANTCAPDCAWMARAANRSPPATGWTTASRSIR
ncbi:MAG: HNH endonuclease signature motif containing protein [Solirubrobacteraceae bacterium]